MKNLNFINSYQISKCEKEIEISKLCDNLPFNQSNDTIPSSQSVSHSRLTRKGKTWIIISQTSQNNKCYTILCFGLLSRLQAHYLIVAPSAYKHICPPLHITPLTFALVQKIYVNTTKLSRNNLWFQKSSTRLLFQRLLGFCFNPLQGLVTVIADQIIQLFSDHLSIMLSKGKL